MIAIIGVVVLTEFAISFQHDPSSVVLNFYDEKEKVNFSLLVTSHRIACLIQNWQFT